MIDLKKKVSFGSSPYNLNYVLSALHYCWVEFLQFRKLTLTTDLKVILQLIGLLLGSKTFEFKIPGNSSCASFHQVDYKYSVESYRFHVVQIWGYIDRPQFTWMEPKTYVPALYIDIVVFDNVLMVERVKLSPWTYKKAVYFLLNH